MAINNITRRYDEDDNLIVSAQIDGITFSDIKNEDLGLHVGSLMNRQNNIWESNKNTGNDILPAVNAVDIDWNGAKPGMGEGENGINTTGELLSILKSYASNNEKINWDEVDLSGSGLSGLDENISYIGSISQLVDLLGAVYEASQSPKAHLEQNGDNQTLVFN